jgi:hypothetical protein
MTIENETIKRLKKNLKKYDELIEKEEEKLKTLMNAKARCKEMMETEIYYIKNCKNKSINISKLLKKVHKKYYNRVGGDDDIT